ncbi:MAG: sodium ion-translocating decarboxylase subunit beta, partial [Halieaceae bacterium]
MENLLLLWGSSGLAQIAPGQVFMILIGLMLLFLAIRRGFEPLLLVPIGFGGILANIPGAGLAYSAVENAVQAADPALLAAMAQSLALQAGASA